MVGLTETTNDPGPTASSKIATSTVAPSPEKAPARNLTKAFEALCMDGGTAQPIVISPTGVADLHTSARTVGSPPPSPTLKPLGMHLHPDLKLELTQAQVNRVSFYGILHDVNKEALALAANDTLSPLLTAPDPSEEEHSPLVLAAGVVPSTDPPPPPSRENIDETLIALIDEEEWLLSTIANRKDTSRPCPATFLQAMGEKEYENPVASLAGGSRTQLWKPSRSWWEAKSGKNPWIEPTSHNKRWRYLWPLIHYHKFLAKCVKKLKRNGVDVKQSVSPVAVFIREEVCAVSDHLAALSLFDSDEWMKCLTHFHGWTDSADEQLLREAVSKLKLRSLNEVADIDSPLLRSQIDKHFLQSMAAARAQMRESNASKKPGHPPVYPRSPIPKQIEKRRWTGAAPPPTGGYPQPPLPFPLPPHLSHYWHPQWDPLRQSAAGVPHQQQITAPYSDNSSVHSGLSADTGSYHHPHPMYAPQYFYTPNTENTWVHPGVMYMQQQHPYYTLPPPQQQSLQQPQQLPPIQPPPSQDEEKESPTKLTDDSAHSPFWSHLDRATLATVATPAKPSPPFTTPRKEKKLGANAQPLLLQHQYYGYHLYEGYGPPSPATQFMMSPQHASSYYNYYGVSPGKNQETSPRKTSPSPSTVETIESESQG